MISDLKAYVMLTLGLLPGELGVTLAIMVKEYGFNPVLFGCWVGGWMTVNFFITAGFQSHLAEQIAAEAQQERIEDARRRADSLCGRKTK